MEITFDTLPLALEKALFKLDRIENLLANKEQNTGPLPQTIPLKKAAELAGKTPNALRVQISLGNLKPLYRGSRIYLDTAYFQRWLRGEEEPENDPREILKK